MLIIIITITFVMIGYMIKEKTMKINNAIAFNLKIKKMNKKIL